MGEIEELVQKGQVLMDGGKFYDALGFFEQALLLNQNDLRPLESQRSCSEKFRQI